MHTGHIFIHCCFKMCSTKCIGFEMTEPDIYTHTLVRNKAKVKQSAKDNLPKPISSN